MRQIHIVSNKRTGKWIVKVQGAKQGKIFRTKKEAGRYTIIRAGRDNLIRVVHGIDGRFVSKKGY